MVSMWMALSRWGHAQRLAVTPGGEPLRGNGQCPRVRIAELQGLSSKATDGTVQEVASGRESAQARRMTRCCQAGRIRRRIAPRIDRDGRRVKEGDVRTARSRRAFGT